MQDCRGGGRLGDPAEVAWAGNGPSRTWVVTVVCPPDGDDVAAVEVSRHSMKKRTGVGGSRGQS